MGRLVSFPNHEISIVVGREQIRGWETYEITTTMLEPANHFSFRLPFDRAAWDLCEPDTEIRILIDEVVILRGFIDERLISESDESVEVTGRSRLGRVVQESAPGITFAGRDLVSLIGQVASPWFDASQVSFINTRNRFVLRGRGKKARAGNEPVVLHSRKDVGASIQPGMTRWQVIETLCAQAGLLCWESGDGTELIVGQPNYQQEIQYRFFQPKKNSTRADESTVDGMGIHESTRDRYSRIIVVGSGPGTDANYGAAVGARYAEVKANPLTPEGDGEEFTAPKRLVLQRPVASVAEAKELAEREQSRRDISAQTVTVVAPGHGQVIAGAFTTIFTYDTLALCEDERVGVKDVFYITGCTYRGHRHEGEQTTLHLIPRGTRLVS